MDPEVPELGSGAEPADCPVWGTSVKVFIKEKLEGHPLNCAATPASLIPSAFILLPENPSLIPEAGCGQSPRTDFLLLMPDWCAKKSVCMYKAYKSGNTIIRKRIRQHKSNDIRQRISTYLIPISKDYFSIDTRLITASIKIFLAFSKLSIRNKFFIY